MKILLTAFDAFGSQDINPASIVLEKIDQVDGASLHKLVIPTVFGKSSIMLEEEVKKFKPDFIISLGQAGGRSDITVERVAINVDDALIKDNDGNMPIDEKIREDGANAYFSSLPLKDIINNLRKADIPANISNSAGTYVCNHIMYQALYLSEKYGNIKSGFVHLPYLPKQVIGINNQPSMSLDMMVKAVKIIIQTCIDYKEKKEKNLVEGRID